MNQSAVLCFIAELHLRDISITVTYSQVLINFSEFSVYDFYIVLVL